MFNNVHKILANSPLFAHISQPSPEIMLGCWQPKVRSFGKNSYIAVAGERFIGLDVLQAGPVANNAINRRAAVLVVRGKGSSSGQIFVSIVQSQDKYQENN